MKLENGSNEGVALDIEPTEEEFNKLQDAVSYLADLISDEIKLNKSALDEIVLKVGLDSHHDWIRNILERACPILERAHNDVHGVEKEIIITELERLGMKKFPAILTYDKAKPKPLSVEPKIIDFGCLKAGKEANATLKVTGGVVTEVSAGKRVKLTILKASDGSTLIKVIVSGSSAGDLFQDCIIIKGDKGEPLKVPVNVQWEKVIEKPIEKPIPIDNELPPISRCPNCDPKIHRKTLFYSKVRGRYRCSQCEHEFSYSDKKVREYNGIHP